MGKARDALSVQSIASAMMEAGCPAAACTLGPWLVGGFRSWKGTGRPSPHRPVLDLATLSSGAGVATDEVLKSTLCEALPFDTRPSDTCIHSSSTCVGKSFWVVSKNVHLLQRVKHTRWRKRDPQVRKQWESLPIVEAEEVCCAVSEDP
eukprot:s4095_g3.t3